MTSHYIKQCQEIVNDYREAGGAWPAKKSEIAEWALAHKRWYPSREDIKRMCGEALTEAMREEVFTDETGRVVRAKLPATTTRDGEQGTFWDDIRSAPADFVRVSVAQRRNAIVADCYHLNNTVIYFNQHHDRTEQIELSLEFARDVRELELARAARSPEPPKPSPRRVLGKVRPRTRRSRFPLELTREPTSKN